MLFFFLVATDTTSLFSSLNTAIDAVDQSIWTEEEVQCLDGIWAEDHVTQTHTRKPKCTNCLASK